MLINVLVPLNEANFISVAGRSEILALFFVMKHSRQVYMAAT